jgi:hypothetical protein
MKVVDADSSKRKPPLDPARIWDMAQALNDCEGLREDVRKEINGALWLLHDFLNELYRPRGRPIASHTRNLIALMSDLIRKFPKLPPKAAAICVLPRSATAGAVDSLLRAYRKSKQPRPRHGALGSETSAVQVSMTITSAKHRQEAEKRARLYLDTLASKGGNK